MQFPIEEKFVVALASSALFDLTESDRVFRERGEEEYRKYQREHEENVLNPGVAFPFVRRLLSLNGPDPDDRPVEVILLSRNDPDTGLRVFNSIAHYKLSITRGAFVTGRRPYRYMPAFNASLFLSANEEDVRAALGDGRPAGQVLGESREDDPTDPELRIAFDFDGVLASDEAERVNQERGLQHFLDHEHANAPLPLEPGPLKGLLGEMARLQRLERQRVQRDANYVPKIRTAIVTSRNAPAHRRLVTTLRSLGHYRRRDAVTRWTRQKPSLGDISSSHFLRRSADACCASCRHSALCPCAVRHPESTLVRQTARVCRLVGAMR